MKEFFRPEDSLRKKLRKKDIGIIFNPNFAIDLQNLHAASRWDSAFGGVPCGIVPPMAGLTPLAPKRCVAARRADFANAKSGLKHGRY